MDIEFSMSGADKLEQALAAAPRLARAASVAATLASQRAMVKSVKSRLNGKPRWGHRGKSRIYGEQVNKGKAKGGGGAGPPGKLSGDLYKGVGMKRKPVVVGNTVTGGVGIGKIVNNLKKRNLEEKFPFFAPGIDAVAGEITVFYASAWTKAINKAWGDV